MSHSEKGLEEMLSSFNHTGKSIFLIVDVCYYFVISKKNCIFAFKSKMRLKIATKIITKNK